jgi:hypothetical protein
MSDKPDPKLELLNLLGSFAPLHGPRKGAESQVGRSGLIRVCAIGSPSLRLLRLNFLQ